MARPRPEPPGVALKNLRNAALRSGSLIPGPSSSTTIEVTGPVAVPRTRT